MAISDGPTASTDGAAPAAVSAVYKDNGAGKVTTVEITFSENVTLTAYDGAEWTIAEAGTIVLADETDVAAATNIITVTASGSDNITGGAINPQITYTADGSNNVNGVGGNTATFTITATDSAAPFASAKKYIDANGDGAVDGVELTLTENTGTCTATVDDFVYVDNDITGSVLAGGSIGCATNKVTLTLLTAGPANTTSHTTAPTLSYTDNVARAIPDALGNQLASFVVGNLTDGAGPVVTAVTITDNSGDGTIDRATLTYSEALQDTASAANGFDVTSAANHGTCDTEATDPTASTSLTVTFACANKYTAVGDMNIAFTANAGILDAAGNQAPSKTLTSSSTPTIADGAKPVMVSAATKDSDANGTIDQLLITFSEPVNITDGGTDDDITLVASSGTATIVAGTYGNANTSTLTYTVLPSATANTAITITPTYVLAGAGSIVDLATGTPNEMNDTNTIAGTDGAGPAILNSAFTDSDADGNIDRAVLTFSESATVSDGNGSDGLDSILINDGSSLAIDIADYAGTAATLTLNFADHTGTAITGLTVTYSTAGSNTITDGTYEAANGAVSQTYTDNAAPVPLSASINKALSNSNLQTGSIIEVIFSEDVTPTAVANGDWKFARNGFESLSSSNWPDGASLGYASGSTANKITMTLTGATTSTGWMNGGKLNLNADNTATIVDGNSNQADKKSTDILLAGLSGPVIGFFGTSNITSSSVTIAWTTQSNTTVNRVLYDTKANYESDTSLDQESTAGSPGEGTKNHSINLTSLTANTIYYYYVCSTESSESCTSGQFTTSVAGDTTAPTVSSYSPTGSAVSINPDLYVQFNEALDPTTIGSSNVLLCLTSDVNCDDPVDVGSPNLLENGTMIRIGGPNVTLSYSTGYWIKVTTGVKNLAGIALATVYGSATTSNFTTAAAGVGSFGVISTTNITNQTTGGAADNSYTNGWEWKIRITLPTNKNHFALKFNNWASGSNALTAAGNMKYYSEQIASGTGSSAGTAVDFATANTFPTNLTVTTDADPNLDGIQTDIHVLVKIPTSTVGGSYSTSYKVNYE